ncbi:OmpA family protein [Hymenobacter koreensis]|uniref:OmpA family protein n=1 Tax=Hymenobacter koreensis TaxID=1084523 RepID=UPI0031E7430D
MRIAAFGWLWLLTFITHAQSGSVGISGSVQANDQAVAKAAVTVVHLPSGMRRATSTDAAGNFVLPNLLVGGPYIVQVIQPGFQTQVVNDLFLTSEKPAVFTFALEKADASTGKKRASRPLKTAAAAPPKPSQSGSGLAAYAAYQPAPAPAPAPAPVAVTPTPAAATAAPVPAKTARPKYTPRKTSAASKGIMPVVSGHYDAKSGNYIYHTGAPVTLKLAGGGVIEGVGVNSTESQLHRFLTDAQFKVDTVDLTAGWMNFDRVYFEAGKATLTKESVVQLRNIASLLRAYPQTRIKLGGYTDSTGTAKVNRLLSEARAQTAWAALVEMGISPSRMEARGYGPRYTIAPNVTEEGRAMNRRLSVKVLAK